MTETEVDRDAALARVVDLLGTDGGGWTLLAVELVDRPPSRWVLHGRWELACPTCRVTHPMIGGGSIEVVGADLRNPRRLGTLAIALGASTTDSYDATRGRKLVRALHRAEQVREPVEAEARR